jgi:16S rRNA (guanine966-N2)-methyltransferase
MRIIAGIYKGRTLKSPQDLKVRPTSDRLRETLFNILNPNITEDTRFLDLSAGTGAVGIEALSRKVLHTTFVEKSPREIDLIKTNLELLKVAATHAKIICDTAEKFLLKTTETFDLVYFDPPYDHDYSEVLQQFGETDSTLLTGDGIFIAEHRKNILLPDEIGEMRRRRLLKQGDSCLSFYDRS